MKHLTNSSNVGTNLYMSLYSYVCRLIPPFSVFIFNPRTYKRAGEMDATPQRFLQNFEKKRICSMMLKLSVALHLFQAKCLMCQLFLYAIWHCHSNRSFICRSSQILSFLTEFFIFLERYCGKKYLFTFQYHFGLIFHQVTLFSDFLIENGEIQLR